MNQESPHGFTSVEDAINKENSSELVERIQIENTPFIVAGNKEQGYWLGMGQYKISETQETKELVLEYLLKNHWNVVLALNFIAIQTEKKMSEEGVEYFKKID